MESSGRPTTTSSSSCIHQRQRFRLQRPMQKLGWFSSSTMVVSAGMRIQRLLILLVTISMVSICNGQQQQQEEEQQQQTHAPTQSPAQQQHQLQIPQYFIEPDSNVTINAGVLLAEPFAYLTTKNEDGLLGGGDSDRMHLLEGFQIDI